ncbi:MAG: methyltransferase domain-containing protein [Nanoarchaeota archaeon]|nr:methyltransferase domain-containing protein [Nanoarchaeota archaeon]
MDGTVWDRIADDYKSEILSPITDSHSNPLFNDITVLPKRFESAIDLGCGLGTLLPTLSKKFKNVVGLDFSQNMVDGASERTKKFDNVHCVCGDMKNLKKQYNAYDAAFSINSILASNIKDVKGIIKEIYKVLRQGGRLFAVLPAMEIYLHQAQLIVDREMGKGKSQKLARKKARSLISKSEHDFILGTINFDGDTQKCFYSFEIPRLFKEAGFQDVELDKVTYSWTEFQKAGQAFFPEAELPWDWYVKCEKK